MSRALPLRRRPDIAVPYECRDMIEHGALVAISSSGGKDSQAMSILLSRLVPREQLLVVHAPLGEVEWAGTVRHVEGFGDDGADLPALASQRLEDFGGALTEFANRYWILGAGGKAREIIEALSVIFALSETLRDAIRYRLPGPGKDGAPALFIANDGRGRFEQLVVNEPPWRRAVRETAPRRAPQPPRPGLLRGGPAHPPRHPRDHRTTRRRQALPRPLGPASHRSAGRSTLPVRRGCEMT